MTKRPSMDRAIKLQSNTSILVMTKNQHAQELSSLFASVACTETMLTKKAA